MRRDSNEHPKGCDNPDCELCLNANPLANPHCPICKGAGLVHPVDEWGHVMYGKTKGCNGEGCYLDEVRNQATEYHHYSGTHRDGTLESFVPRDGTERAFNAAKVLAGDPYTRPFLIISGSVGCGKTHLCNGVCRKLISKGLKVKFVSVEALMTEFKEGMNENTLEARIKEVKEVDVLVLDDYMERHVKDETWTSDTLYQIIDHRYNLRKTTMVTTNLQWDEFPERIKSRFMEVGNLVANTATDYRTKKGRKK